MLTQGSSEPDGPTPTATPNGGPDERRPSNVAHAVAVLLRRFYLSVPLVAGAILGAQLLIHSIAPEYQASARLLLIGPNNPIPTSDPYVRLGPPTLATVLQVDASSPAMLRAVTAAGNSTDYTVSAGRSPVITITDTDASRPRALSTVSQLVAYVDADAANRQKPYGTDPTQQITIHPLGNLTLAPNDPASLRKADAIATITAVIAAIALTLMIDTGLEHRAAAKNPKLPGPRNPGSEPASAPNAQPGPGNEPATP